MEVLGYILWGVALIIGMARLLNVGGINDTYEKDSAKTKNPNTTPSTKSSTTYEPPYSSESPRTISEAEETYWNDLDKEKDKAYREERAEKQAEKEERQDWEDREFARQEKQEADWEAYNKELDKWDAVNDQIRSRYDPDEDE